MYMVSYTQLVLQGNDTPDELRRHQPLHLPDNLFTEIKGIEDRQAADDVVPFDFEKYYEGKDKDKGEAVRELVTIPADEIVVATPTREHRSAPAPPAHWAPGVSQYPGGCLKYSFPY